MFGVILSARAVSLCFCELPVLTVWLTVWDDCVCHVCANCSIKAGQERRLQDKKRDSMRKKERSRRDWD